jgi:endonuclease/exonuclease/phosphatase family metal-dependent hydrolase
MSFRLLSRTSISHDKTRTMTFLRHRFATSSFACNRISLAQAIRVMTCSLIAISISIAMPGESSGEDSNSSHRVLSYNIKRGYGNDGKTDLSRTADVISKLHPDFVGLQEVDERCNRSGNVDQAQWLGEHLDMHAAFAPFMDYDGGRYGMAILSRYPIEKTEAVELARGREPRVALAAHVTLPDGNKLTLVNVHFDYIRDDTVRFEQATKVREFIQSLPNPAILLGDFNDTPESRTVKLFQDGFVEADKPADDPYTFSADKPDREIDFLFASPESQWTVKTVEVIDEPLASDHRPVIAVFQLKSS